MWSALPTCRTVIVRLWLSLIQSDFGTSWTPRSSLQRLSAQRRTRIVVRRLVSMQVTINPKRDAQKKKLGVRQVTISPRCFFAMPSLKMMYLLFGRCYHSNRTFSIPQSFEVQYHLWHGLDQLGSSKLLKKWWISVAVKCSLLWMKRFDHSEKSTLEWPKWSVWLQEKQPWDRLYHLLLYNQTKCHRLPSTLALARATMLVFWSARVGISILATAHFLRRKRPFT